MGREEGFARTYEGDDDRRDRVRARERGGGRRDGRCVAQPPDATATLFMNMEIIMRMSMSIGFLWYSYHEYPATIVFMSMSTMATYNA